MHGIDILVVDVAPQFLKLFLGEVFVQPVFGGLRSVAVLYHFVQQDVLVERALHQCMDALCHRLQPMGECSQTVFLQVVLVALGHHALLVDIPVIVKVGMDRYRLVFRNHMLGSVCQPDSLITEELQRSLLRTLAQRFTRFLLQVVHEGAVAFVGDDGQFVDVVYVVAQRLVIHAVAVLVHAEAQAASHFLPFVHFRVRVAQRADLEYFRIVPPLAQSRMRKDKPCRLVEAQQAFLVFQNQVVGGNVVRKVAFLSRLAVDGSSAFLVYREIAVVYLFGAETEQISLVSVVKQRKMFVQQVRIFLFEDLLEHAFHLVALFVVAFILCHFVDEKERKRLNAFGKQFAFFSRSANGWSRVSAPVAEPLRSRRLSLPLYAASRR